MTTAAPRRRGPDADALPAGYRLHWYELQSVLGVGGFGITYLARDTNLNQAVAIKEYFPHTQVRRAGEYQVSPRENVDPGSYRTGLSRFLDEARLLARFRHPHIVRVLSVFEALGTSFIVMEFERGRSLYDLIAHEGLHDDAALLGVTMPLMDGLDLVHQSGFIHRDIKPSNILVRADARGAVLIDFGAARHSQIGNSRGLTAIVSRGFAPFEQYDTGDEQSQGPWTDIYAIGATMYLAMSGQVAVDALARATAILNGGEDPLVPLEHCAGPGYSTELIAAVQWALAFRARDRPQSITAWAARFPAHQPAPVQEPSVLTEAIEAPRGVQRERQRARAAAAGARADDATEVRASVAVRGVLEGRSVMIVDDERAARELARRVLARYGVSAPATFAGVGEALEALGAMNAIPDLVICDLAMPGQDGIDLLRRLHERNAQTCVLLLGGRDERVRAAAESVAAALGFLVLGSLAKPLDPEALAPAVLRMNHVALAPADASPAATLSDHSVREGFEGDALRLAYLPKVELSSGRVVGAEALLRWGDGRHDAVSIIARLQRLGLSDLLTDRVLEKAFSQAGEWRAAGTRVQICVNVFAQALAREDFADAVTVGAEEQGVDPSDVVLDISERGLQGYGRQQLETLVHLCLRGVGLAVDDFGVGAFSLEELRRVPMTEVKIDRSLIVAAGRERVARAVVQSSVTLARELGLRTVAEGVEDRASWDLVRELGFDLAQGYFVSKPIPGTEFPRWCEQWDARRGREPDPGR